MTTWAIRLLWPAIASVVLIGGAYGIGAWIKEKGRDEMRPEIQRLETALAAAKADRARADAASAAYRSEMDALRRRAPPRAAVRLCVDPAPVPATRTTTGRIDDRTTTSWGYNGSAGGDLEAGPDIGPELYGLAGACDAEIAKLRALQGWVRDGL